MANKSGKFTLSGNLNVVTQSPLDTRQLVDKTEDLTDGNNWRSNSHPAYKGMFTVSADDCDLYILKNPSKITAAEGWKRLLSSDDKIDLDWQDD